MSVPSPIYRVSTEQRGADGNGMAGECIGGRGRHLNGGTWELVAEFTEAESWGSASTNGRNLKRHIRMREAPQGRDVCSW